MDKLKMHSPDITQQNVDKLLELFPNCKTEKQDANGELGTGIDFDLLKQELSKNIVEGPQERYQLNWPGKKEALLTANAPIAKTLRPCREESVDFDTTENLFIEGDNLEALKLLQETYLGKVKMIYIDPPYNTGKDFIYADNFSESTDEYLQESGQKDDVGNRLVANTESNGRFHSDWLSMMYSRLRLAKNLLSDDGGIFISINQKEEGNLRKIADEIYGEDNLLCIFSWKTDGNFDNQAKFKYCHEYILVYSKNESSFPAPLTVDPNTKSDSKIFRPEIRNTIVKNGPKNPASEITLPKGFPAAFEGGTICKKSDTWPNISNDIVIESFKLSESTVFYSGWSSKDLLESFIKNNCQSILDAKGQETVFEISKTGAIEAIKIRGEPSHVISMLTGFGGTQKATAELSELGVPFDDYPKPVSLLKYFNSMINSKDHIVMDFFAGSATSAHAALQLNSEDGGNRKFILVQLPEECDKETLAYKAGHTTISEVSKERIRRAGKKIKEENPEASNLDIGFRVLKIDSSNMNEVHYTPDSVSKDDLFNQVEHIKTDRSSEDLLFQVMLDWGVDLSLPIRKETIEGKEVYFVNDDDQAPCDLVACFDKGIDEALIKVLAAKKPLRVVFRDDGFGSGNDSDSVKINVEQIFKQLAPATDIKAI
jgi:adenine-specific DNA-methyltransferase